MHPSKLPRVVHTFRHIYLNTQKLTCWTQSYDPTNGSLSPYKMIYKVVLVRPHDVEYDRTQQYDDGTSPPKRKSRLDHALYMKCLMLKYHMTFKHIHLHTYNMPLVDVV